MIPIPRNCFVFLCSLLLYFTVSGQITVAQQVLDQDFQFSNRGDEKVGDVLGTIANEFNVYFSYQDTIIKADQPIRLDYYEGSIEGFLVKILGTQYEFKEIPGYVIIRYAPGVLEVDVEMESGPKQWMINGFIRDSHTGENISYASIYDRNSLASTPTDENGYFELQSRQSDPVIWLTISKSSYRDTTFMLLPGVDIRAKKRTSIFRYYQEDGSVDELEQSFFGRMFIGFRQRFQRINLGGFFVESPYQMSLVPGLSSQGMFASQMINKFSLNLVGGYTAGVDGFEAAGIFNINQKDARYFQMAGVSNTVGGNINGFQVSGIHNLVYKNVNGIQVAGLYNHTKQQARGLQVAGLYNRTHATAQHQIAGLINNSATIEGIQIAGLINLTKNHSGGLQLAGLTNFNSGTARHQIAGLLNRATEVKGVQFSGLLNIAETSDYPIGLLNLIKTGKKSLAISISESSFSHLTFRSGGRVLYGVLGTGYQIIGNQPPYALEAGFGIHLIDNRAYFFNMEFVSRIQTDFRDITDNTGSLKFLNGINFNRHLGLFAGPTVSFSALDGSSNTNYSGWEFYKKTNSAGVNRLYGGFTVGIQYAF